MIPRLNIQCRWRFCYRRNIEQPQNEFYLDRARSGIFVALQSLHIPPKSKVGMMVYNCNTVMNAINYAGFEVSFVDVTPQLTIDMNSLREKVANMKVLIVTHLFGIVNEISAIRKEFPQLIIIEDCAHAMGCNCGHLGDFAVYSIGQGKFPSVGEGGILRVNNETHIEKVQERIAKLPKATFVREIKQYIYVNALGVLHKPLLYCLIGIKLKKKQRITVKSSIVPKRMTKFVANIWEQEKYKIPFLIAEQQKNASYWKEYLKNENCAFLESQNCFMLPVWSENKLILPTNIETATHFSKCIEWAKEFGYQEGTCPNAEILIKQLVMLPCYYNLTKMNLK